MKTELRELLRDEDLLLTSLELRFMDEVNDVVDRKLDLADQSRPPCDERVLDLRSKIAVLEENVILILKRLKKGRTARGQFVRTYPKWRKNLEKCIVQLIGIADSIKNDRFKCNVSKLIGHYTSAVGGGITLVSAILIPFTLGLTTPLAVGGGILTAAGVGTSVGTSITEITLLKSKVDRAKELTEKDEEYVKSMSEWLEHATDLQEAISNVLDIDIVTNITEQVANFVRETKTIMKGSERKAAIEEGISALVKNLMPEYTHCLEDVTEVVNIISILVAVFLVLQNTKNRLIFDCVALTIRSILGVGSLALGSLNVLKLSKTLAADAAVARNLSKAITRGAMAVLGIALDVVGIVFTSADIRNGSLSPEAEKIAEAASSLREEADILDRVYKSISM